MGFIVGVTGGIGCGKTAVTDYLAGKGITIADADLAARVVVEPGQPALEQIAAHFGTQIIQPDGYLDRKALREIVFQQPDERRWLEQLLHPIINQQLRDELSRADSAYSILVTPLLAETGQKTMVDRVMVIDIPEQLQIERTMARDNISQQQAEAILHSQASRQQRLSIADDIVDNSTSLAQLHSQLDTFHHHYLQLVASQGNGQEPG